MAVAISINVRKHYLTLLLLIALLSFYSCKENSKSSTQSDQPIEIKIDSTRSKNNAVIKSEIITVNQDEVLEVYKYVNAPSGLNFRDKPDGEILGTFPNNLRLKIIANTGIEKIIKDKGLLIKGEWVQVSMDNTEGFVFDGFLSNEAIDIDYNNRINNLSILTINGYEIGNQDLTAFISLTDGYWNNKFPKTQSEDVKKNQLKVYYLKGRERAQFLANREIKESDNLYLYNYEIDKLIITKVIDIPLLSHESIYGGPDYLTGFDVKGIIDTSDNSFYNSFASIGRENPFETGKVQTIRWQSINVNQIPTFLLSYGSFYKTSNYEVELAYHYYQNGRNYYYTRNSFENGKFIVDYIFVMSKDDKLLFITQIKDTESSSPSIYLNDNINDMQQSIHFTGRLFKNKPPVIFGLYYTSFGCPFIDFLSTTEPSVYLQCDNRH